MKKIFTFCFFAFAMLIGTQSALAQDKVNTKEKAYLKAKEMRSTLKFNDNTLEQVYNAYHAYEKNLAAIEDSKASGNTEVVSKLNYSLQADLKTALGEELYNRYLNITNKKTVE
ncbi:hypothetical protein [Lacinutrix sp. Bg11-31]|uniref:hypothetical protein n=1 Tax=Lacinutrix sp. Bg11-31 TaxID=2057808 RepID=UPI000C2FFAA3|nr:hypothetical protein [Lacinutrix sp. Bg11-31]AUC83585.1 hypothetical protein CW733_16205 [Lacinutrix sp. Bg11-31]